MRPKPICSFTVRMKRSATPLVSGWRTKAKLGAMPKNFSWFWESVRNSVRRRFSSRQGKTVFEQDGELGLGHGPLPRWHFPLLRRQVQHQEQEFQRAVVGGKVSPGSD